MKKMNKKGFTIVELVIVIAVIAILSAVLIPTFSGVVGQAKETARLADAKAVYQEYVAAALAGTDAATLAVYVDDNGTTDDKTDDLYVVIKNGEVVDEKSINKTTFDGKYTQGAAMTVTGSAKTFAGLYAVTEKAAG